MFERESDIIRISSDNKVKSVTVKVKIISQQYPWRVADIQFQEGASVTQYVEHVSEMERTGG